ncbi:MAG: polysaccharide lyase 6 family protein [Armatimonadota bacterium]
MKRAAVMLIIALAGALPGEAEVHEVSTCADLNALAAEGAAQPGDEIVIEDGEWLDAAIDLNCSGREDAPITVRPQTPGGLTLTGASSIRIAGSHVVVSGIQMRGGMRAVAADGVEREQRRAPIDIHGDHCRVTECAIIDYNPVGRETRYMWVVIRGVGNRVDHCYFRGQDHSGVTMTVNVARARPNEARIDHNYFAGKPPLGANGGETIRIGTSHVSVYNSRTTVENNLFEHCDGEGEIISNKSCENVYRRNTFRECAGELTLRHGDRCIVEGNVFLCNDYSGSRGVRLVGRDHHVINNYVYDPDRYGVALQAGIVDTPLSGYVQVERALVAFNTIVAPHGDCIRLVSVETEGMLPAIRSIFANNILLGPGRTIIARAPNPDDFTWAGNIAWGGELGISEREGITWADPMLVEAEDGLLRPSEDSPAIGAAAGTYDYDNPTELSWLLANITRDIDGQSRDEQPDIGCDELSEEPIAWRPLTSADVGPTWMR